MKRLIFSTMILLVAANNSIACTACGCSASTQYMGLLPQTNDNFIGFQYFHREFSTNLPYDGGGEPFGLSNDKYSTLQLWGRYNITRRIQIIAFIPYIHNTRKLNDEITTINGIGDMTFIGSYRLLDKKSNLWKHTLSVGLGFKMPTGKYDANSIIVEEGLPNMQTGTNSWDIVSDINYTINHGAFGINADLCYVKTTPNHDSYKFGDRQSAKLMGFYELKKDKLTILPQLGFKYDRSGQDYHDFSAGMVDDMSGGWQLHTAFGGQIYYKQLGLQLLYNQPVAQYYNSEMVTMKYRIETGVLFMF